MQRLSSYTMMLALASAALLAPRTARAQVVSEVGSTGHYSLTLKVLPAESFTGANAEMARDGGAEPATLHGSVHPNHHLVVFIKKDNKPVEQATVTITYRKADKKGPDWTMLPVTRMHVKGQGPETTHFGNNLYLAPGTYDARVMVNGSSPVLFKFKVGG